jgi:hypothetical protein
LSLKHTPFIDNGKGSEPTTGLPKDTIALATNKANFLWIFGEELYNPNTGELLERRKFKVLLQFYPLAGKLMLI